MKKVLIIVGDASETLDTLYPFYRLQEAGIEPGRGRAPKKEPTRW
jgi:protease I